MLSPDNVFIAIKPADMRRGIDTLTQYIQDALRSTWHEGAAFVFVNKARSRIKVLRWDKHEVWLCTRRLHKGSFRWPRTNDVAWHLTPDEFNWLIAGVAWQQVKGHDLTKWVWLNEAELRAMALAMVQKVMSENAEKERELLEKSRRIQLLEEMLKLVRQQRFGKKCETLAGMQRSLFEEDVDADIAALTAHLDKLLPQSPEEDEKAPRSCPIRKPLPVHLPRVEKIIQPDTDHCPECDELLHYIRDAVSEKLEYIPAHFVVNRYVRPQYSCPCCLKVFSGEMPAHILPKSAVEPAVIAQVIINKYSDHLPLYRQQQIFARSDVGLPVSSMADMVGASGATLSPLAALLHRELISRQVVHADETTLKILNTKKGGKSCSCYLWAYVSGERTGPSVVCFDCRTGRSHEYPENWLQSWVGTLVVDGHKAYRTLANKVPEITLAGCWAHVSYASETGDVVHVDQ
ncbi:ISSfl3 OrfC [Escherichia coli]|nr:ISSfl3 OrfC [Escherichia coli]